MNLRQRCLASQHKSRNGPKRQPHNTPSRKIGNGNSSKFKLGGHSRQCAMGAVIGSRGLSTVRLLRMDKMRLDATPDADPAAVGLSIQGT